MYSHIYTHVYIRVWIVTQRFKPVMDAAKAANVKVRGYVSCALGCPYEGEIDPEAVSFVTRKLLEQGTGVFSVCV
jgi:hypothetical protein